jgi:hypothetical protein
MDRRRFLLTSLAGALATPLAAEAQKAGTVHRIGYLYPGTDPGKAAGDAAPTRQAYWRELTGC